MILKEYLKEKFVLPTGYLCCIVNADSKGIIGELLDNSIEISNSILLTHLPESILNMTFKGLYIRHITCSIEVKPVYKEGVINRGNKGCKTVLKNF